MHSAGTKRSVDWPGHIMMPIYVLCQEGLYLNLKHMLIVKTFLNTDFEGGRHKRRVDKISLKMY